MVSANRILLRKGFVAKGPYTEAVKIYDGDIVTADFDHPETVVKEVNAWSNQQTQGAIPELISAGTKEFYLCQLSQISLGRTS